MARRIAYTGDPVLTLEEVARQCRLDVEDLQAELIETVIIPGVTQQGEVLSGAAIRTAEYEERWPPSRCSGHALDMGQANEIIDISHIADDGTPQSLEVVTRLQEEGRETRLYFPAGRPVGELLIRYRAGTDLERYPGVRCWLLMHAATAHEFRETLISGPNLSALPDSFLDSLLADITVPPRF
ncbi:hypothetical protein M2401_001121 [Pseudomonas sp. JUb42]|uniref:hypothetical protein n=1 Tax=Pseudomonas sp. JUb42 TaxID=2940611 RepID=UPI0021698021|nr:hypothetical protein [Pseudomonas sp. JUb42]MCS3467400.1 hypothetical protein [Pseudomonas sp. JUb42]